MVVMEMKQNNPETTLRLMFQQKFKWKVYSHAKVDIAIVIQ